MAVILLRHTTPDVAPGTCYGVTDLGLAPSFEKEADAALRGLPEVSCIITSPLSRCYRLAQRIGGRIGLEVRVSSHWREMDFGRWEGTAWSAIPRGELDAWAADFHGYAGHGGETVSALADRVNEGLSLTPKDALVVTHAGCIKAVAALRGLGDGWETQVDFGGTLRL